MAGDYSTTWKVSRDTGQGARTLEPAVQYYGAVSANSHLVHCLDYLKLSIVSIV